MEKIKLDIFFTLYYTISQAKIHSKEIKYLSYKLRLTEIPEENLGYSL